MLQWKIRAFILLFAASIGAEAQTYTRLASVAGFNGSNPVILVQGSGGNFYGVAYSDESSSVIFKMTPPGTLSEVYTFGEFSGADSLIAGKDGNLYGLSYGDGNPYTSPPGVDVVGNEGTVSNSIVLSSGCGTIFKIVSGTSFETLYNFTGATDGEYPETPMVEGPDRNLYSTASLGLSGNGHVFKITPSGTLTTLYNFCMMANCADGGSGRGIIQARRESLWSYVSGRSLRNRRGFRVHDRAASGDCRNQRCGQRRQLCRHRYYARRNRYYFRRQSNFRYRHQPDFWIAIADPVPERLGAGKRNAGANLCRGQRERPESD